MPDCPVHPLPVLPPRQRSRSAPSPFRASVRLLRFVAAVSSAHGPWPVRPALTRDSVRTRAVDTLKVVRSHRQPARDCHVSIRRSRIQASLLNVLNASVDDIQYDYTSRLRGEPSDGVSDVHFHPAEPRQVRVSLEWTF